MSVQTAHLGGYMAYRSCRYSCALALVLLVTFGYSLWAQEPVSLKTEQDRELIAAFFAFQDSLAKEIARENADAKKKDKNEGFANGALSLFGVSAAEFTMMTEVSADVTKRLRTEALAFATYAKAERTHGRRPSKKRVREFEVGRSRVLEDGLHRLQQRLSAKGWEAVWAYIQGPLRSGLVSTPLPRVE